jgi:hypothetical protein
MPCKEGNGDCLVLDGKYLWVEAGWMARCLAISAFPAFLIGSGIVYGLSRFGISEVVSFTVSMPVLIAVWFYFVGRLVDRGRHTRPA